jgi:hypothetical protein
MAIQNFKMYMVVGTGQYNHGNIDLRSFAPGDKPDDLFGVRLIKEVECEFDVPEFDLRQMEIDALEKCVVQERADAQVRVNLLLDRISKLKAIGHESLVADE